MNVSLKTITPNAEVNIVEIARVSSSRENKSEQPEKLIQYLLRNKHFSPFEHAYITFEIDTSKAIGIQLLRHVSFRFQEFSQRYAVVEGVEPIEFRLQAEKNRQSSTDIVAKMYQNEEKDGFIFDLDESFHDPDKRYTNWIDNVCSGIQHMLELYKRGIELGIAKECARFILPMATSTKIYMTGSIRSWIHCLEIRDDAHAQKEVQLIAKEIKRLFIKELPIISNALNWKDHGTEQGTSISREGESGNQT